MNIGHAMARAQHSYASSRDGETLAFIWRHLSVHFMCKYVCVCAIILCTGASLMSRWGEKKRKKKKHPRFTDYAKSY